MKRIKPTMHEWREVTHTVFRTEEMPDTTDNALLNIHRYNRVMLQLSLHPKERTRVKAEIRKQELEAWFLHHHYTLLFVDDTYTIQKEK